MSVRLASHKNSWYSGDRKELDRKLSNWLAAADRSMNPTRAIIAPHAGYEYCGACGAFAYKQVDPANIKRIFILGPSHHYRLVHRCGLSMADQLETPLYNLQVDTAMIKELMSTGQFDPLPMDVDEAEHSLEMHMPYIAKVMEGRRGQFKVVPVMVGTLLQENEAAYGRIFSKYLQDSENFFVISSDFCHWGDRFRYTYYDKSKGDIWQSIEALDRMGMDAIERLNTEAYYDYLRSYRNTICGRHPIGILLNTVNAVGKSKFTLRFTRYAQSNRCLHQSDSSVSYASAALVLSDEAQCR